MYFKGKTILVTGAAGFIGSNLVDRLLELGAKVIGLDNLFNGRRSNLASAMNNEQFQFHKGDIRDLDFLLDLFEEVDIVFHEAAFTSVPQSVKMPENCNDVNVNGVINVLNAARRMDVGKIVFASSSSVYGDTPELPKKESMKRVPISPYGVAKLACEAYMQTFNHVYGLNTVSLRYFNVFGPRQKDSTYSGVIAIWLGNIIRDENLLVFGNGKQSRDFTYVKDVVEANLLAAHTDVAGEIFNIGAGSPITLNELGELMLEISGKHDLKLEYTDPRSGDILHSYADISKAKEMLGFEPRYNQEEGLRDYFEWYKNKYNIDFNFDI